MDFGLVLVIVEDGFRPFIINLNLEILNYEIINILIIIFMSWNLFLFKASWATSLLSWFIAGYALVLGCDTGSTQWV